MQQDQDINQDQGSTPRAWYALGSYFGPQKGDEITMSIGPHAVHFLVDVNDLRQSSRYEDRFLAENPLPEAPPGASVLLRLPEVDPQLFYVYWKWLGCRNLITRTPRLSELSDLFLLGRSMEDTDFTDLVIDKALEHSYQNNIVLTEILLTIYLATEISSPYRLLVKIYIIRMWRKDHCRYWMGNLGSRDHSGEVVALLKSLEPSCRSAVALRQTDLPGNHPWDQDPCYYHEHTKHGQPCYRVKYNFQEVHPRPF